MLGLKFAYATNGREIIECDYFAGTEAKASYRVKASSFCSIRFSRASAMRLLRLFCPLAAEIREVLLQDLETDSSNLVGLSSDIKHQLSQ